MFAFGDCPNVEYFLKNGLVKRKLEYVQFNLLFRVIVAFIIYKQEAQLLLGDRVTRKHAKDS